MTDFPVQQSSKTTLQSGSAKRFDMRNWLFPKRLTMIMWDYAFLTRHVPGDSFADYDKVLDEAMERGYNTVRIDPLPQCIDLSHPDVEIGRGAQEPYHPWDRPEPMSGPMGRWLIDFMEKVQARGLNYCLSAWGKRFSVTRPTANLWEMTQHWKVMLRDWKRLFGFDRLIFVDLTNEFPYFIGNDLWAKADEYGGCWTKQWNKYVGDMVNRCLADIRAEFPEVRFTVSLHGDVDWIDMDLDLDVMDIHFYADADKRFSARTGFDQNCSKFFTHPELYKEFSDRCMKSHAAMAPMYRARQRNKLSAFADFSAGAGIPLTTTESWASWFYIDHPDLDWTWLLEWAEWSVEDAIDFNMWGWTPHNYCQPQFANWQDVNWHRRLTDRFLRS